MMTMTIVWHDTTKPRTVWSRVTGWRIECDYLIVTMDDGWLFLFGPIQHISAWRLDP